MTYYDVDHAQQSLVWMSENGQITRQIYNDLYNIYFSYADGNDAVLVQYVSGIEPDFRWEAMTAHRFYADGSAAEPDTLAADTIGSDNIYAGVAFDEVNNHLLAATITAHALQYPTDYRVQLIRYENGAITRLAPWDPGAPPAQGYHYWFTLAETADGGGVLAFQAAHPGVTSEVRFRAFDADGIPSDAVHLQPLDPAIQVSGLDVTIYGGTVYAMYTAQCFDNPDLRGAYVLGFPLSEILAAQPDRVESPQDISLIAYPNPFNAATRISYSVPAASDVSLRIFDVTGRRIADLVSAKQTVGEYSVLWSGEGFSSGVFFARLSAGSYTQTQKLVLLR